MANKLSQEQFEEEVYKHNSNIKIISRYKNMHSSVTYKCKICGFEETINDAVSLYRGHTGCGCCSNRKLAVGMNDLYTKRPDLLKYFVNKEDAKTVTISSTRKVSLQCPVCGCTKQLEVNKLTKVGFHCNQCSDSFSYPERFMYTLLSQLNINFATEVDFKWCDKNYRYDFVFDKIIVEMDGSFHKIDNNMSGQTKEQSKAIDDEKDRLAFEHGYKMIRIDCDDSNYVYIKNNIINSELNNILDLGKIDWSKLEYTISDMNMVKMVADLWKPHIYSNKQIAKRLHIGWAKVQQCLKTSARLRMTDYNAKASTDGKYYDKSYVHDKEVICNNDGKVFKSGKDAEVYYNLKKDAVCAICRGDKYSIHGLIFDFVNTTKEIQDKKKVMLHNKKVSSVAKKVYCVELNLTFDNATKASLYLGHRSGYVSGLILNNKTTKECYHFKYIK